MAHLKGAILIGAHLKGAELWGAHLEEAELWGAHLEEAEFSHAHLKGAKNLTIDQLSKVKTLYNATLDEELLIPLKKDYPALFENTDNGK